MDLKNGIEEILDLQKESYSSNEKAKKKLEELRKEILKKGSTSDPITGDYIRDFVIATHGVISEETEDSYRKLEKALSEKEGEQVLVVREDIENSHGKGFGGGYSSTNVTSFSRLGVLTSDIIFELGNNGSDHIFKSFNNYTNLHGPRIIIPTEKHVKREYEGLEWELIERGIEIPVSEICNLDLNGERTLSLGGGRSSNQPTSHTTRLLINTGNGNILKYFKSQSFHEDDLTYVKAARFLNIEDRLPRDFVQAYDEKIYVRKVEIIENLKELTKLENEVSSKERENNIVRNLEYAIEFGMQNEEWILDGENPGETLNVPKFISKLSQRYEVKINWEK